MRRSAGRSRSRYWREEVNRTGRVSGVGRWQMGKVSIRLARNRGLFGPMESRASLPLIPEQNIPDGGRSLHMYPRSGPSRPDRTISAGASIIDSIVGFITSRLSSARLRPEPSLLLGNPFSSVLPLRRMKKPPAPTSRRRSQRPLGRKTFVYLADHERDLVDEAASLERRSVSSFIAHAAVQAAERVVTQRHSNKR